MGVSTRQVLIVEVDYAKVTPRPADEDQRDQRQPEPATLHAAPAWFRNTWA
jgi:hypothetical protein